MSKFIDFLVAYKEVLLISFAIILIFIGLLIKRRPKTLDEFSAIMNEAITYVPLFASKVERPGEGPIKQAEVCSLVRDLVCSALGRSLSSTESKYLDEKTIKAIDSVLSSPKKKVC